MPCGQGRQAPLDEIDVDSPGNNVKVTIYNNASKDAYIDGDHAIELTWLPQYREFKT
jgi:hypothetical protein